MGNILRCFTGGDNHGDDHYRPHYHPTSEPGIILHSGWGSPPRFQPDHHQLGPHGGVASLVQDLFNFESTSMVPEALRNNVTSSKKAQVKWYRNILEAYKNCSPPPKTAAEAARLVAAALSRIQRADLEGFLAFYNLLIPSFSSASTSSDYQPSSLPEGIQFVLNTLPVHNKCIGDGDGFTAYVDTADPRESANVPLEVHEMVIERTQARIDRDYQTADALLRSLNEAGYKGIDAPELKMASGKESRNALVKLIGVKRVTIYVYGQDQFGRYVGDIYCDNVFIQVKHELCSHNLWFYGFNYDVINVCLDSGVFQEQMLKSGHVWLFKTYDKRPEFAQWEREARAACRGLFASENPEKPWDWRRDQRNANIPVY
ncbi:probable staphylococcal-like nuclease CAN2 isoform X2 [Miscanthus floridulus]|uniref:probable staphylococcal-like nuclease CAN2 isoform X2 n=1 Tax=Miscanthus floridulus TaxID=154761 RepID=UPI00345AF2D1